MTELETISYLKGVLAYDRQAGVFRWKVQPRYGLPVGSIAGFYDKLGYLIIGVRGTYYKGHRLAWLFENGSWPSGVIDHINGDPSDNRIANLRVCTQGQNICNRTAQKNSRSGIKGVFPTRNGRRWSARLALRKEFKYLGTFDTKEEAHAAYCAAAGQAFGEFFHP